MGNIAPQQLPHGHLPVPDFHRMVFPEYHRKAASVLPVNVDTAGIVNARHHTTQSGRHLPVGVIHLYQLHPAPRRVFRPQGFQFLFFNINTHSAYLLP